MIRAIRPSAMAQDDASLVSGWNVAPNVAYTLVLLPGGASCGVLLLDEAGLTLVASGAALVGTNQPCVLAPQSGQAVGMVDADLGWHLLLSTAGTESQRTIRIGPAVDLPDEIHPVYGDDALALARATAAIDSAAHYIDDVTVTCPLGIGAGLGDVVSVFVDGAAVVGQVESITWVGMPDGVIETAVIRQHVAIAPDACVAPTPLGVVDDTGAATHLTGTTGNVLANDGSGLTVVAVNGLSANVGEPVGGDNGGSFTINSDGSWTFAPGSDFELLDPLESVDTRVAYHASDGTTEEVGSLVVTVTYEGAPISLVGSATASGSNGTYGTVSLPELQAGDLILLIAGDSCSSCTPDIQVSTAGYTQYHAQTHSPAYNACLEVFYKIADGTETEISLRGVTNSAYKWTAVVQVWRGVDQATPFDVAKVGAVQTNAQPNSPAITPVTQKALIVTAATAFSSAASSNPVPPSEYAETAWITYAPASWVGNTTVVASKQWSGSGSEDPGAWSGISLGSLCAVVSVTMALRPAV